MQRLNEKKRQGIVQAAAKLFAARPFHEVKLDDVAAAARVGKGTVYIYFKNKDDLFCSLVYDGFEQMVLKVRQTARQTVPAMQRLRLIISELINFAYTHPHFFEVLRTMQPRIDRKAEWRSRRTEMTQLIEQVIREGVAAGELRDNNPQLTALCLPGLVRSVMLFGPQGLDRHTVEEHLFGLIWNGIGAAGCGATAAGSAAEACRSEP